MVQCIECKAQGVLSPRTGKPFTAGYGLPNGKRTHCTRHKSDEMVNLANQTNGCVKCKPNFTNAVFGLLKDGKKISCSKHI